MYVSKLRPGKGATTKHEKKANDKINALGSENDLLSNILSTHIRRHTKQAKPTCKLSHYLKKCTTDTAGLEGHQLCRGAS